MKLKYFLGGIATVLILILLAGGAYFMGRQDMPQTPAPDLPSPTLPPPSPVLTPDASTATPTTSADMVVEAGGAVSFPVYAITIEPGWIYDREHDEEADSDTLTIERDGYQIRIMQGATGGLLCLYPGDADVVGPSQRYTTFTRITTVEGIVMRRGGTEGSTGFTLCEEGDGGDFVAPTSFGHIGYTTPASPSDTVLAEMDDVISSIESR